MMSITGACPICMEDCDGDVVMAIMPRLLVTGGHTFCEGCLGTMLEPLRMWDQEGRQEAKRARRARWSAGRSVGWRRACPRTFFARRSADFMPEACVCVCLCACV